MSTSPALQSWQDEFAAQPRSDVQRAAFQTFLEAGLPTTKQDAWKYTDLRRFATKQFKQTDKAGAGQLPQLLEFENRIVFIDGVLQPSSFAVSQSISTTAKSVFELLNTALSSNTVAINVKSDTVATSPIYIVYAWTSASKNLMSHPRVELKIGRGARATVIEHSVGTNAEANFCNSLLNIVVEDSATLEHIRIQDDATSNFNIANIHVDVQRSGAYSNHHYVLGASLARTDLQIKLTGREGSADLHGLILAQHSQHLDVHTCIDHQVPNTRSNEDYRGIADQRGRVVFRGKVIVAKEAQHTDAAQSSRNLLLSAQAEIDTRPELEIYANDVKCAHGATVGQLDATSLFYLRSRGIDANEARALLTHAFAAEVIERIPVAEVREHLLNRFMSRMRALETT